jgi:hypothetical protein
MAFVSGHSRRAVLAAPAAALAASPVTTARKNGKGKGKGKGKPLPPLGYVVARLTGVASSATAGAFDYELLAQGETVGPALHRKVDAIVFATIPIAVSGAALVARLKTACALEVSIHLQATGANVPSERLMVTLL